MPKPDPEAYRRALVASRGVAARIDAERIQRIQQAVRAYARGISQALRGADLQGLSTEEALTISERIVRTQSGRLLSQLNTITAEGRTATFEEVLANWEETSAQVLAEEGTDLAALGGIRHADVSLVNAFDAIGAAENWRTLIQGHVENAAAEANEILRRGLAEKATGDEMARRLRRYVEGAEDFQDLFEEVPTATGKVAKIDLRRLSPAQRGAAAQMRFNARRIAFSEIQNARAEAEIQHFLRDPLIEAVRWTLSPNRGVSFTPPDECDVLAESDFYGMGQGVYPIDGVPPPPHPFDRCEKTPVTRGLDQAQDPKPLGKNRVRGTDDVSIPRSDGLSEARIARIRANVDRSLLQGDTALRGMQEAIETGRPVVGVTAEAARAAGTSALSRSADDVAKELREIKSRGRDIRARVEAAKAEVAEELEEARDLLDPLKKRRDSIRENWLKAQTREGEVTNELLELGNEEDKWLRLLDRVDEEVDPGAAEDFREKLQEVRNRIDRLEATKSQLDDRVAALRADYEEARDAYQDHFDDRVLPLAQRNSELHRRKLRVTRATRNEQRKVLQRPEGRRNTVTLDHQLRKNREKIEKGVDHFRRAVDRKYLDGITLEGKPSSSNRAFYRHFRFGNSEVHLHPDGRHPKTVLHEIAHAIEYEHPEVRKAFQEFYESRTAGEPLVKLNDVVPGGGYRSYEKTRPDDFFDPYAGKFYDRESSELVTMGLQEMWYDPVAFYEADPEHFELIWRLMNGAI